MPESPRDGKVSEFLREVKELDKSVERQDSLRTHRLERDIMEDRQRRRDAASSDRYDDRYDNRHDDRYDDRLRRERSDDYDDERASNRSSARVSQSSSRQWVDEDDDMEPSRSNDSRRVPGRDREKYNRWVEEHKAHREPSRREEAPYRSGGFSKKLLGGGPLVKTKKPLLGALFKDPGRHSEGGSHHHHHHHHPHRPHRRQERSPSPSRDRGRDDDSYDSRRTDDRRSERSSYSSREREHHIDPLRKPTQLVTHSVSHSGDIMRQAAHPMHRSGQYNRVYNTPASERLKDFDTTEDDENDEERFRRLAERERELARERDQQSDGGGSRTSSVRSSKTQPSYSSSKSAEKSDEAGGDDAPALPSRPGRVSSRDDKLERLRQLRSSKQSDEPDLDSDHKDNRASERPRREFSSDEENGTPKKPSSVSNSDSDVSDSESKAKNPSAKKPSASYYGAPTRSTPAFIKSAVGRREDDRGESESEEEIRIPNPVPRTERSFVESAREKVPPTQRRELPDRSKLWRPEPRDRSPRRKSDYEMKLGARDRSPRRNFEREESPHARRPSPRRDVDHAERSRARDRSPRRNVDEMPRARDRSPRRGSDYGMKPNARDSSPRRKFDREESSRGRDLSPHRDVDYEELPRARDRSPREARRSTRQRSPEREYDREEPSGRFDRLPRKEPLPTPPTNRKVSHGLNTAKANLKSVGLREVSPEAINAGDGFQPPRLRSISPEKRTDTAIDEAEERIANLKLKKPPPRKVSAPKPAEAATKLKELRGVEPAPVRKESVPEALKKLESLKPSGVVKHDVVDEHKEAVKSGKQQLKNVEQQKRDVRDEMKEMVQSQKASLKRSESPPPPPAPRSQGFADDLSSVLMRGPSRESLGGGPLRRTSTIDSDSSADQHLDHMTKSRPKGPKRRLPASHSSSHEDLVDTPSNAAIKERDITPSRIGSGGGRAKFDTSFLNAEEKPDDERKAPIKLPTGKQQSDDSEDEDVRKARLAALAKKKPPKRTA